MMPTRWGLSFVILVAVALGLRGTAFGQDEPTTPPADTPATQPVAAEPVAPAPDSPRQPRHDRQRRAETAAYGDSGALKHHQQRSDVRESHRHGPGHKSGSPH